MQLVGNGCHWRIEFGPIRNCARTAPVMLIALVSSIAISIRINSGGLDMTNFKAGHTTKPAPSEGAVTK